jgi:hypothetical protein
MTLGNMRHLGVHRLVAHCLNPSCRHEGLFDVSKFADDVEVPSFAPKVVCAKCGVRGRRAAELERAAAADEVDRQGLALMARWRVDIIRAWVRKAIDKSGGNRIAALGGIILETFFDFWNFFPAIRQGGFWGP